MRIFFRSNPMNTEALMSQSLKPIECSRLVLGHDPVVQFTPVILHCSKFVPINAEPFTFASRRSHSLKVQSRNLQLAKVVSEKVQPVKVHCSNSLRSITRPEYFNRLKVWSLYSRCASKENSI